MTVQVADLATLARLTSRMLAEMLVEVRATRVELREAIAMAQGIEGAAARLLAEMRAARP